MCISQTCLLLTVQVNLCPEGKSLRFVANQKNGKRYRNVYRSEPESCTGCPRAKGCFRAKPKDHRQLALVSESKGRILLKEMRDKIDSHEGRRKYSKRMGIIEPVFGNITGNKGMNYFTMRGEMKVNIQWMLYALVHNIEKLLTTGAVSQMGIT